MSYVTLNILLYLLTVNRLNNCFLLIVSSHQLDWKVEFWASNLRYIGIFRKKSWKLNWEMSSWIQEKSALFSAVAEKISADFAALKNRFFSADQNWFSAIQRFLGNVQCWIRLETALVSAINFWIRDDQRWNPLRAHPGWQLRKGANKELVIFPINNFRFPSHWLQAEKHLSQPTSSDEKNLCRDRNIVHSVYDVGRKTGNQFCLSCVW